MFAEKYTFLNRKDTPTGNFGHIEHEVNLRIQSGKLVKIIAVLFAWRG